VRNAAAPIDPTGENHEKFFGRLKKFATLTVYSAIRLVVFLRP
jgi:hypothetical protein